MDTQLGIGVLVYIVWIVSVNWLYVKEYRNENHKGNKRDI